MASLRFNGNPDHPGISTAMPLILLVAIVVFYLLLSQLAPAWWGGSSRDYLIINGILAIFLGLAMIAVLDPFLKRVWPSGHVIEAGEGRVAYRAPGEALKAKIDLTQPHKLTCWYFRVAGYSRYGRERQIKRGDFCFAAQLQQEEERIVAHTYVSSARADEFAAQAPFIRLEMEEIYDTSLTGRIQQWRLPGGRPDLPPSLIVSERGRYWLAERYRWHEGIELRPGDFQALLEAIQAAGGASAS